jgi:hypothetical protein
MKSLTVGFVLLGIIIVAGLFLLSSWILMLLVNVPLAHYDAKLLDFGSAMAIDGLIWLGYIGGNVKGSTKD